MAVLLLMQVAGCDKNCTITSKTRIPALCNITWLTFERLAKQYAMVDSIGSECRALLIKFVINLTIQQIPVANHAPAVARRLVVQRLPLSSTMANMTTHSAMLTVNGCRITMFKVCVCECERKCVCVSECVCVRARKRARV
jgi:hypothetical protein